MSLDLFFKFIFRTVFFLAHYTHTVHNCTYNSTGASGSSIRVLLCQATTTTSGTGIQSTRERLGMRASVTSSKENLTSSPMGAPRRGQRSLSWHWRPRRGRSRSRGQDGSAETATTLSASTREDTEDSEASLLGLWEAEVVEASGGGSLEDGEAASEATCKTAASIVPVYFFLFVIQKNC